MSAALETNHRIFILTKAICKRKNILHVQLMHQAYVYKFKFVLLLIGDKSGNIIRGVWVRFDTDLLDDYRIFLKFVYSNKCLSLNLHCLFQRMQLRRHLSLTRILTSIAFGKNLNFGSVFCGIGMLSNADLTQ